MILNKWVKLFTTTKVKKAPREICEDADNYVKVKKKLILLSLENFTYDVSWQSSVGLIVPKVPTHTVVQSASNFVIRSEKRSTCLLGQGQVLKEYIQPWVDKPRLFTSGVQYEILWQFLYLSVENCSAKER